MNIKRISVCAFLAFSAAVFAQEFDAVKALSEKMVAVEGGSFQMGSSSFEKNESPVHEVTVSSFYISSTEVTQKEYEAVMGENLSFHKGENFPVEEVSWYDAVIFCNRLSKKSSLTPVYSLDGKTDPDQWGEIPRIDSAEALKSAWNKITADPQADGYRLPTEAEWEFAARGGNSASKTVYSGSSTLVFAAWASVNSADETHEVAKKNANALGLYDMSGNVWEWCWDWYGNYHYEPKLNPAGEKEEVTGRKIRRGGSIKSADVFCRNENRASSEPSLRGVDLGFRVARSVVSSAPQAEPSPAPAVSEPAPAALPPDEFFSDDDAGLLK